MLAGGGITAIAVLVLWGLSALAGREQRMARVAAVVAPHLPARSDRPRRPSRPLRQRALVRALARVLGLDLLRLDSGRVPWWVVLAAALPLARVVAGVLALLLWDPLLYATPLLWVALCRIAFGMMAAQRRAQLFRQFPDALGMMTRLVRVGIPVTEAVRIIARESPRPTAEEFGGVANRLAVGMPLDAALSETARHNGVPEYGFFSTALSLQAQTGGGLSEALDNLADVIRKRIALRQRGYALAAEARTSAAILGALPFLAGALLSVVSPKHMGLLFTDPQGQRILSGALLLLGLGLLAMRHMIRKALS
jgi:tight adherence protein B